MDSVRSGYGSRDIGDDPAADTQRSGSDAVRPRSNLSGPAGGPDVGEPRDTQPSMGESMTSPTYEAPGPGPWELETAHYPKPFPRFGLDGLRRGFVKGFKYGTARYGLMLSHFESEVVNGFIYQQPVAFGAPKGAAGPPPKPILWLLTRLHPALRKRIRTGRDAFAEKRWREDMKEWDEVDKPEALKSHAALLAVDPKELDDGALARHLTRCDAHVEEMIWLHHKYTIPACAPIGDFLAQTMGWTGRDVREVLAVLRGSSRISLGFSAKELERAAALIAADDAAKKALLGGDGGAGTLKAVLAIGGEVATATKELLDLVEHRALGYDVGEMACGEMPSIPVKALRAALSGAFEEKKDELEKIEKELRDAVPTEHRATFDDLLVEARFMSRLRDERGMYADCWAVGIARRALLEAGRRLASRGLLREPDDAVDLTSDEAGALLGGGSSPTADVVHERATWRRTKTTADAPPFLNGQPGGPPDIALLPEAARRPMAAVGVVIGNLFCETSKTSTKETVRGISVNTGVYEGIARLVDGASDFHRIEQGDVLVTRSTAPYFNVVLPMLGAIVTDRGGQLCHAAIVAREYGIPGVVGTKEATKLIPDGARVRVDGGSGEITVLS
jgi:phosphohistidine swiveling domain-containing protein